ncbi:unnamed protein product [Linum tenue]|uniref:Uncharacterized protein n=2 Tax=Linum TaxID=4005 RepID=A0AAV0PD86_9ROSI|nr:unnamed protein product [Linum tenue]
MEKTSIKLVSVLVAVLFLVAQYGGVEARSTLTPCEQDGDCAAVCPTICTVHETCECYNKICRCLVDKVINPVVMGIKNQ